MAVNTEKPQAAVELQPSGQVDQSKAGDLNAISNELITAYGTEYEPIYLTGIRLYLVVVCLAIALFVTNLEIPIVTTSLVAITKDLGRFDNVGWIISSYLLGYVGVLVIFAKLSDIFGRKLMLALSLGTFIVFSAGCGVSQSLIQLIVLRAFQGVGGAGCFALSTAMITELVPSEKYAKYVAIISTVFAVSLLVGPIIGGALSEKATWRWVFLINIPIATPALICLIFAVPRNFPNHGRPEMKRRSLRTLFAKDTRRKVDVLGAVLLLLATLSLTAGFEEAGSDFPWRSAYVIALLTVSGLLWIVLMLWERRITQRADAVEPVLPWRFFDNRAMISLLLNALFLGGPWFVAIFQLPQKFQLVHGSSGTRAGVQTMPFTFAAPLGSVIASAVAGKLKVPAVFVVLSSGIFQTIGFALLASLPTTSGIPARAYGYQIIAGFGCGINSSTLLLLVPFVVEVRDRAVGMGAVSQLRIMGGAISLAIATSVFNSYTRPRLQTFVLDSQHSIESLYAAQNIALFGEQDRERIRGILAKGYNLQMYVLCAFAAAQIPSALLLWRKEQIRV